MEHNHIILSIHFNHKYQNMAKKEGDYVEGRDLMVYIFETDTYKPQAAATSHRITYSGETKERVTKDSSNGAFSNKKVTKLSVTIQCEALTLFGTGNVYEKLLAIMKSRQPVKLKYGYTEEAGGASSSYEEGMFVITSLEQSSPADDDATYSATFENDGNVETKTGSAG